MDSDRARALLTAERDEIQRLLKGENQVADEAHVAEVDSEAGDEVDAAQPLNAEGDQEAIAGSLNDRLDRVERALQRLDAGTYGICEVCGGPIGDGRLQARPTARVCIGCASHAIR